MAESFNQTQLEAAFRLLGLHAGMHLIMHSSMRRLGYVDGGADTVIDALQAVITDQGTLVMPSFNHGQAYAEGEIFNIKKTKTLNGIIPDTFWRRPDVCRSLNPTNAFAAWGRDARRYTAEHHLVPTMGKGSPLDLLMQNDGYCLLLGVGYESNTFHHYVETILESPCLSPNGEAFPVRGEDGRIVYVRSWGWRAKACPINDKALYAEQMAKQKVHRQMQLGNGTATIYRLRDGFPVIAEGLKQGVDGHPPCHLCPIRPRVCRYTVNPTSSK